jgi:lysophospholipase L1-like esterase
MLRANTSAIRFLLLGALLLALVCSQRQQKLWARKESVRVLCFGDSLTAGWGRAKETNGSQSIIYTPYSKSLEKTLGKRFSAIPVGFPGWTSRELLEAANGDTLTAQPGLKRALKQHVPAVAIIMVGTNDIFKDNDVDGRAIARRVWALHTIAHDAAVRSIAVGIPIWSDLCEYPPKPPVTNRERLQSRSLLNKALFEYAEQNPRNARYVDFPFTFAKSSDLWDGDGLHLSPQGYLKLGASLARQVRDLLAET